MALLPFNIFSVSCYQPKKHIGTATWQAIHSYKIDIGDTKISSSEQTSVSSQNSNVILIIAQMIVLVTSTLFVGLKTDMNLYTWFQTSPYSAYEHDIYLQPACTDITSESRSHHTEMVFLIAVSVPALFHQRRMDPPREVNPSDSSRHPHVIALDRRATENQILTLGDAVNKYPTF